LAGSSFDIQAYNVKILYPGKTTRWPNMKKKILSVFFLYSLIFLSSLKAPTTVSAIAAGQCQIEVRDKDYKVIVPRTTATSVTVDPSKFSGNTIKFSYYLDPDYVSKIGQFKLYQKTGAFTIFDRFGEMKPKGTDTNTDPNLARYEADIDFTLQNVHIAAKNDGGNWQDDICPAVTITPQKAQCNITSITTTPKDITLTIDGTKLYKERQYELVFNPSTNIGNGAQSYDKTNFGGGIVLTTVVPHNTVPSSTAYQVSVVDASMINGDTVCGPYSFTIDPDGKTTPQVPIDGGDSQSTEVKTTAFNLCEQINDPNAKSQCQACATSNAGSTSEAARDSGKGGGKASGIWTAVGCIPTSYQGIVSSVVKIGLSISGGVALLLMISAGFMLTTSQGEPKKKAAATELLTSAVMGLLFIIFSVTILQFIGFTVLQIPGFGR
jgi:hypothetical protein